MNHRLSAAQIRGARGMLNWSMLDLSKRARVSISTIKRVERDEGLAAVSDGARLLVRDALEAAGVAFSNGDGEWIGLRPAPRHAARSADGAAAGTPVLA